MHSNEAQEADKAEDRAAVPEGARAKAAAPAAVDEAPAGAAALAAAPEAPASAWPAGTGSPTAAACPALKPNVPNAAVP